MFNFYDNNYVEDNFREWSHAWHSSSQLAELSVLPCESWYKSHIYSAVNKTLPEAQRTQGIDSLTWIISPAK